MQYTDGQLGVLWVAKGLGPGGMERLLVNHARCGDRERFRYHAAYLVDRPNSVIGELEDLGVTCSKLAAHSQLDPRWALELRRLVAGERIDVVHVHSPMVAAVARPALRAMRHRPKLVYTEHNSWDCYGRATRWANALTYPLDDAQIAVSGDAKRSVPKMLARRVEVLTHGIELDSVRGWSEQRAAARAELGVGESTVVITAIANLRFEKAYDVLLAAAAETLAAHDDVVFLGVGHGQLQNDMNDLHARLGLGDRFRFLGFRSDALRILAASDVFTLASRNEGLPVSLMEASALGLPTVATAVGGLVDYVVEGVTGLLVPAESPHALAEAYGGLIVDRERRESMGKHAAEAAAQFDASVAVRRLEAIYAGLV